MRITFSEPFSKKTGISEWDLEITANIPVKRLLEIMAEEHPFLNSIRHEFVDRYPYGGMLLINKRSIARPDDIVRNTDYVEVIPPLMGG